MNKKSDEQNNLGNIIASGAQKGSELTILRGKGVWGVWEEIGQKSYNYEGGQWGGGSKGMGQGGNWVEGSFGGKKEE